MFSFVTFQDDDAKPIKKKPAWIAYGENPDGTTGVFSGGQWDEQELASAKAKMEKELALVECHQDDDGWTSDDDEKPQNRTLLVLMGLPGAGKSSLTEELVKDMHKNHYVKPLKHVRLDGDLGSFIYLGHIRDKYPGTDALAYEHDPILDFLKEQPSNTLVYGEGARITSVNFLQKVQDLGYKVTVVKLDIDQKTGNMRCIMRDDKSFSDLHFQKLATVMQKIEKEFNFWSLSGVDSLIKNAKHLGQIIAQINGVEFKEKEEEKWTEQDEKNLTILQGLNSRPNAIAKIDYDIQLDLEAKKKRIEEKKKPQWEKIEGSTLKMTQCLTCNMAWVADGVVGCKCPESKTFDYKALCRNPEPFEDDDWSDGEVKVIQGVKHWKTPYGIVEASNDDEMLEAKKKKHTEKKKKPAWIAFDDDCNP